MRRINDRYTAQPSTPRRPGTPGVSPVGTGLRGALAFVSVLAALGCDGNLDAGGNVQDDLLPVGLHCPVILDNDNWSDNWAGENAFLLANSSAMRLVGLIVNSSRYWPNFAANKAGWNNLVSAARQSGLRDIPDVTEGASTTLKVPADRKIDSTLPLHTAGAELILNLSRELYLPGQPLLVITGSQLTNLADAYLIDRTVIDRVVVVSSLGAYDPKAVMTGPNGDLDPWADWIVAQRFRYVQVAVRYDQAADVTDADLPKLPKNKFGDLMRTKQPGLSTFKTAADQLAVLAARLPEFVTEVQQSAPDLSSGFNSPPGQGPSLLPDPTGSAWVVTQVEASMARKHLWEMLGQAFGTQM